MICILCISDSDKHFTSAIAEYVKRLGKEVEIINIKPIKYGTKKQIIQKETHSMMKRLENKRFKNSKKILLSKEGKQVSTEKFVAILGHGDTVTFIIGGPYGLDESALEKFIDRKIAFGKQTMPHGLAKLVLIEQIYRAGMIESGRTYHW